MKRRRPIVQPDLNCPFYAALHQTATAGLRQRALSGAESARLAAETARLAAEAEQVRAARREREAHP